MNGRLAVVLVLAAIAIAALAIYAATTKPQETTPTTTTSPQTTTTTMSTRPVTSTSPTVTPTQTGTATSTPVSECREKITLTVLTRHPGDILEMAKRAFLASEVAKRYCIEEVRFLPLPPGFWITTIKRQAVDVAWGGGPTLFDELYLAGLLRPLETEIALKAAGQVPDIFAGVPLKRVDEEGKIYWVSAAIASFGFTVNTDVARQLGFDWTKLRSWRDLASDELGLILTKYGVPPLSVANPLQSTSNTRMYEIILQAYGWEEGWRVLTLMAANARIEEGSGDVRDAVINGDVMVGITIDFYGYTAENVNPACRYVLPEGETIVNGDPIAVTKSTKHPEAAEAFVAWVLTEGQKIWLDPSINRLPSNPHVFETEEGSKRPDLKRAFEAAQKAKTIAFNDTLALLVEYPMQLYWVATLKDNHDLLQRAWRELLKAYYIDGRIDENTFQELKMKLTELVTYKDPVEGKEVKFTLEDALRVSRLLRENLELKEAYMNAWREAAKLKYEEVLRALGS